MITREEVQHIAKLARLQLTDQEIMAYQKELSIVLEYFDILKEARVEGVVPMTHSVDLAGVTRDDTAKECENADELLKAAPSTSGRFLRAHSAIQRL
ncbi:MAG: Asp-tRNA(Asn)/Glu-tRNA(Gln) amidotransferase subunit GatC [Candidatus Wildermuthbacteria bacterium]|nr:Asp-tRNA(Asn)/Glu-tRNA(Gln) amidotransferase subunit GatC [Candidatus Wildermuthbacteria bacterium]